MNDDTTTPRRPRFGTRDLLTTYGSGRTCGERGCETVLSQYNDEDRCGMHTGGPQPKPAGMFCT